MRTQRLLALLRQRCPVCGQGRVFTGVLAMHKNCPHCGVIFEREHGYFLNSMFIGYTLGFLLLIPVGLGLFWLDVSTPTFAIALILITTILWPLIFRWSRLLWMHVDQWMDPR